MTITSRHKNNVTSQKRDVTRERDARKSSNITDKLRCSGRTRVVRGGSAGHHVGLVKCTGMLTSPAHVSVSRGPQLCTCATLVTPPLQRSRAVLRARN